MSSLNYLKLKLIVLPPKDGDAFHRIAQSSLPKVISEPRKAAILEGFQSCRGVKKIILLSFSILVDEATVLLLC